MKKKLIITLFLLFTFSFILGENNWKLVRSFNFKKFYITGIFVKGDNFYFVDKNSGKIFLYDMSKGKVIKSWKTPSLFPSGLSLYNGKFYMCEIDTSDDGVGKIYEIDIKTGNVTNLIYPPALWPTGISATDKGLWVIDDRHNKLFLLDKEDGTILKSFHSPANNPTGIDFDGKYLYIGDRGRDRIYVVYPKNGDVLYSYSAPDEYVYGISKIGKEILYCSDLHSKKVYELKLLNKKFVKYDYVDEELTFSDAVIFSGKGNVNKAEIYFPLGRNRGNQTLISKYTFFPEQPSKIVVDEWGEKFAIFSLGKFSLSGKKLYKTGYKIKLKLNKIRWFIDPEKVGTFSEIPEKIRKKYLGDGIKYQLKNPYIVGCVKKIVGSEKNLYWIARKLYNFVISRVSYKRTGGWETAPVVLKRGSGSCSEYTFSYISLCRSAGIPARYVGTVAIRGDETSMDWVFHRWAEIYLPNYGWIPVDTSRGKAELPADVAKGFGFVDNRFFITTTSGGPEKYLGWSYNSGSKFIYSPSIRIKEMAIGNWEPLKVK